MSSEATRRSLKKKKTTEVSDTLKIKRYSPALIGWLVGKSRGEDDWFTWGRGIP